MLKVSIGVSGVGVGWERGWVVGDHSLQASPGGTKGEASAALRLCPCWLVSRLLSGCPWEHPGSRMSTEHSVQTIMYHGGNKQGAPRTVTMCRPDACPNLKQGEHHRQGSRELTW